MPQGFITILWANAYIYMSQIEAEFFEGNVEFFLYAVH